MFGRGQDERLADRAGVLDHDHPVVEEALAEIVGRGRRARRRTGRSPGGSPTWLLIRRRPSGSCSRTSQEVELELPGQQLHHPVHHPLGIEGGGDVPGGLVEQRQLADPPLEVLAALLQRLRDLAEQVVRSPRTRPVATCPTLSMIAWAEAVPTAPESVRAANWHQLAAVGLGRGAAGRATPRAARKPWKAACAFSRPMNLATSSSSSSSVGPCATDRRRDAAGLAGEDPDEAIGLRHLQRPRPACTARPARTRPRLKASDQKTVLAQKPESGHPEELLGPEPGEPEGPGRRAGSRSPSPSARRRAGAGCSTRRRSRPRVRPAPPAGSPGASRARRRRPARTAPPRRTRSARC